MLSEFHQVCRWEPGLCRGHGRGGVSVSSRDDRIEARSEGQRDHDQFSVQSHRKCDGERANDSDRKIIPLHHFDEIYHGLVYEGKEHSILEFTDRAFVINGFSKLYAMTGWRLGYVIAPIDFIRPMQKLQQNLFISASSFAQRAHWPPEGSYRRRAEDEEHL